MSGLPWISQIPILKYLFGQNQTERIQNEILFVLTPHIVRSLDVTEFNTRGRQHRNGERDRDTACTAAARDPGPGDARPRSAERATGNHNSGRIGSSGWQRSGSVPRYRPGAAQSVARRIGTTCPGIACSGIADATGARRLTAGRCRSRRAADGTDGRWAGDQL